MHIPVRIDEAEPWVPVDEAANEPRAGDAVDVHVAPGDPRRALHARGGSLTVPLAAVPLNRPF